MTQPIRNFEYQKSKARAITKRVDRLKDHIKALEEISISAKQMGELGEEYINIHCEDFNNELYDLAEELHNMEIVIVEKLEIE